MPVKRGCFRFDNVAVDLANLQVTVGGELRPLEPKSFRLLQFLMENRGRAVAKEEILAAVWPETAVTDNALTRAIAQVRKALGDDSREPRYIETVPTVGYRFVAEFSDDETAKYQAVAGPVSTVPEKDGRTWLLTGVAVLVMGLGIVWSVFRESGRVASVGNTFLTNSQLSSGGGLDVSAVFSPDGNSIAYSSDRSGKFEIYVRSLESVTRDGQVTNNGGENMFPCFSPDGQDIVYSSARGSGIYRTPTLGGTTQRLTEFGSQPVWSPDGKWIVFVSQPKPSLSTTDHYYAAFTTLWLVSATGGQPRQITTAKAPEGGQTFASWSGDSSEIRFVNYLVHKPSVWTYRMSDGKLDRRFELPGANTIGSATFSRDGRAMYYVNCRLNGDIGIWLVRLDPALQPLGEPERVFQPTIGLPRDLSLSPDGKRIVYSASIARSQLLIQSMKGDEVAGAPVEASHETGYRYTMPMWSPDGRSIVYTTMPVGRPAQIWVDRLDGNPATMVGRANQSQHFPHFTNDGKAVRFQTRAEQGVSRLLEASLEDGSLKDLGEGKDMNQTTFSPDGSVAVFHSHEADQQVWALNLKTALKTQLTFGPEKHGFARFSVDGKWLAVERLKDAGVNELWVLPSAGGSMEAVWKGRGNWFVNDWSRDGDRLLIAANRGRGWGVYTVSRSKQALKTLIPELPMRMYIRYPRWSPDETRIAYELNEAKGNVFLAELGTRRE